MFDQLRNSPGDGVVEVVQRFLKEHSIERPVSPHEDLREAGLSSLDMVNLVLTVEAELGVTIPDREITPANFRSISAIDRLLTSLMSDA
jgi:acyl carrier protein